MKNPDQNTVQTSMYSAHVSAAGRRMMITAQKAEVPLRYQMILGELDFLHDLIQQEGNAFNAICLAFDYGFVKGCRATRKGKVKAL